MKQSLSPRFLKIGYVAATLLVGAQAVWLASMVLLFQMTRLGLWDTSLFQSNEAQPSIASDPLIQLFGYVYVGFVAISFIAVLMRRKWAFWTYLIVLISHAGIWVALTDNPFVLSHVTLVLLVAESGILLLIQLLGNAGKLK